MPTFMNEGTKNRSIVGDGLGMVLRNKRYIIWFWLLNLLLTIYGTSAFRETAHTILDHSLNSQRLLHGFDIGVFTEFLGMPKSGPTISMTTPAIYFAIVFFLATALFLPGVLAGYASTYRFPRDDFFRACGRNLWRFIRLMIVAGIIMAIVYGILFAANGAIATKASESTNEVLPFQLRMIGLFIIFLVMTVLRIWFDLAEADIVLNDQRAVRKSIALGFRHAFRSLTRLLASYVFATLFAVIVLAGGIWCWINLLAPTAIWRAAVLSQVILFLLLIPRFWQRGMAVSYWQQKMLTPVVAPAPIPVEPAPLAATPEPAPVIPATMPPGQGS